MLSGMHEGLYVQYGCGWCAPTGWKNFDASPTLRFERVPLLGRLYTKNVRRFPENVYWGDIAKGLPVEDCSCAAVYCSHVLEHLSLDDMRRALKNTYKMIAPGGIFRLVLPDLEFHIKQYFSDSSDNAAYIFMRETSLGSEHVTGGVFSRLQRCFGNSRHLWMWDYKALATELSQAGFVMIRRAQFGDSCNHKFRDVEDEERWKNCLGVECMKPDD